MIGDLVRALADLEEQDAVKIVDERLNFGVDPLEILKDARQGMEIVGKRFAAGDYFLSDLIYSGEILKRINEVVKPKMTKGADVKRLGEVVLGTVAGDIHDIGLNIVDSLLDANGFKVYNLGTDVSAQRFVDKIKETGAPIVGLSGLLTLSYNSMRQTVSAIEIAGLRDRVKIMIGGNQVDEKVLKFVAADGYGNDAMVAVTLARKWTGGT
jgi:methanogenic corrinoid protein MtbC1